MYISQKQYARKLDDKATKYLHFIAEVSARLFMLRKDLLYDSRIGTKAALENVSGNTIVLIVLSNIMGSWRKNGNY